MVQLEVWPTTKTVSAADRTKLTRQFNPKSDTVESVKNELKSARPQMKHVSTDYIMLYYRGVHLENSDRTLESYDIKTDAILYILLR